MGIQSHIKASPNNTTVSMPCQAQISIDAKRIGLAWPADSFMKFSYIRYETKNYFKVTFAPSPSNLALMSSASALDAASLITLGAPSTNSFASFKPKPVTSRTTLITLTLAPPISVSSTSNSSFSSAAAPSAAPPAATTADYSAASVASSAGASPSFSAICLITRAKLVIGD